VTTVETPTFAAAGGDGVRRGPRRAHPAPNNVGVALLLVVVLLVVGAVALMGVPAIGKLDQQTGCAATVSRAGARPDCGADVRRALARYERRL
jgi:ABC-type transporter Mla subunit MlaD